MAQRKIDLEYEIDASLQDVWRGMTDVSRYPDWNPFVTHAESDGSSTRPGVLLNLTVQWHDGGSSKSTEEVVSVHEPAADDDGTLRAEWIYSFRSWLSTIGLIRSVRTQRLTQIPDQPTKYSSHIHLTGWGVIAAPIEKIEKGMIAQAEALRDFVQQK